MFVAALFGALENIGATLSKWIVGDDPALTPQVVDDVVSIDEDTSAVIDILGNDLNVSGLDNLAVNLTQTPQHGVAELLPDGDIRYSPEENYSGNDSFGYKLVGANGSTDAARVHITVASVNDPPIGTIADQGFSYPKEVFGIIDISDKVFDAEGPIALASVGSPGTAVPASTALQAFERLASSLGDPLPAAREILSQRIFLPISDWVEENAAAGGPKAFTRDVEYVLADSDGLAATHRFQVEISERPIMSLAITCPEVADDVPKNSRMALYDGPNKLIEHHISASQMDRFGFSGFDPDFHVSDVKDGLVVRIYHDASIQGISRRAFRCSASFFYGVIDEIPYGAVFLRGSSAKNDHDANIVPMDFGIRRSLDPIRALANLAGLDFPEDD